MGNGNTVTKAEPRQPQTALTEPNPMTMLQYALENGFDLDRVDRIMQLERQWKADKAREAFNRALAEWKKQPLTVLKDKLNKQYNSQYSSIGNLVNTVNAAMAPFGLSTDWTPDQSDSRITVTCTLTHELGHSKSAVLSGQPDTSGSKNPLQQIKSTLTYLEIATFQAVTGVVAVDAANLDDDGNAAGGENGIITAGQVEQLEKLIVKAGADRELLLRWAKVESLEELPARKLGPVCERLNDMIEQARTPAP